MTMAIFREDDSEHYDFLTTVISSESHEVSRSVEMPLINAKLRIPPTTDVIDRESLLALLDRSTKNSAASLLVGRAGSGKTALAASFARRHADHSWYSIDASDADWHSFQRYFRAALTGDRHQKNTTISGSSARAPVELFADIAAYLELLERDWPAVIVLDNVHHLFDCQWFEDFFSMLIASLPHTSHVILISRSKPPTPVWRLRSKQMLNVIDEKSLAFSLNEAVELFAKKGLNKDTAARAQARTFGRPADMIAFLDSDADTPTSTRRSA